MNFLLFFLFIIIHIFEQLRFFVIFLFSFSVIDAALFFYLLALMCVFFSRLWQLMFTLLKSVYRHL